MPLLFVRAFDNTCDSLFEFSMRFQVFSRHVPCVATDFEAVGDDILYR